MAGLLYHGPDVDGRDVPSCHLQRRHGLYLSGRYGHKVGAHIVHLQEGQSKLFKLYTTDFGKDCYRVNS